MPNSKTFTRTLLLAIAILSAVLPAFTHSASAAAIPCDLSDPNSPLTGCKAVILVSPLDTDQKTQEQVTYANLLYNVLYARGATVTRVYPWKSPCNITEGCYPYEQVKWNTAGANEVNVVDLIKGAHIFVYRGHGIKWGTNEYGGINLKTIMVDNNTIRSSLSKAANPANGLAPNAIVMLFACWATGTGNDDVYNKISITAAEARNRVNQYAEPYMTNGAGAVYADWAGNAFPQFITDLISGMTLGEAYKNYNFNPDGFTAYSYPRNPEDVTWVDYHYYAGLNQYNHSFVGNPNLKMRDLFVPRLRLVGSTTINLKVNTFHPATSPAQTFTVYVTNTQMVSFNWSAVKTYNRSWVLMPRTAGTNVKYDPLTFTITTYGLPVGTYTEQIVVSTSTANILDTPQTITMTIEAYRYPNFVFLPALSR